MTRWLYSWLGRPAKPHRRGLLVERLEDRLTPAADKALAAPVDLSKLATTQDLLAFTNSPNALSDLSNVVQHLGLDHVVDLAASGLVMPGLVQIHLRNGVVARNAAVTLYSTGLYTSVTPNYVFATGDLREAVPNDPQFPQQFPHGIIGSSTAWNKTVGSPNVVVAVLDDGVDIGHPDLLANIWSNSAEILGDGIDNDGNGYIDDKNGWDFSSNTNNVNPDSATDIHGTQIAGVLAGRINNNTGIAGVAGGSRIMPLQVIGTGATTSLTLIRAINYAVDNGAKIINCSINIDPFLADAAFKNAVQRAYDSGVLWVNSAGNLNLQDPLRANFDNMLIVGATDRADKKSSYSNYGWGLDIVAPGGSSSDGVLTTIPGGYGTAWGTSISAPLVAGTAALLWSANPSWSREQVINAILVSAVTVDPNFIDKLGTGRLDAGQSVSNSSFVTPLGNVYDIPGPGEDPPPNFDSFRQRLHGNLDGSTVVASNFELRWAGGDNTFDTADDRVIPLTITNIYQYGTNSVNLAFQETLERGLYRYTAKDDLRDPFGNAIDGDLDGIAGGDLHRYFGRPIAAQGTITTDIDGDGPSSGDPGVGGVGVFPDFNNNGQWDTTSHTSTTAPFGIADNDPNNPATLDISISGHTRPVNYISVRVLISHPAPADLIITLRAPNGQIVTLLRNRPLPADVPADSREFIFADDIVESITASTGLVVYKLRPDEALASLYGSDANGVWQVSVADTTPGDSGTLISAAITIGEEPLVFTNERGEWVITNLPDDPTTIRILPPAGWVVRGNVKEQGIHLEPGHNPDDPIAVSVLPETGIAGRVVFNGQPVDGQEVLLFRRADFNPADPFIVEPYARALSGSRGEYVFGGLPLGEYVLVAATVRFGRYEVLSQTRETAISQTQPQSLGNTLTLGSLAAPLSATITPVSPTLGNTPVPTIRFRTSTPVAGLSTSNITLTRDGTVVDLKGATVILTDSEYRIIGLSEETATDGTYVLAITLPNGATTSTSFVTDRTPPTAVVTPIVGPKGVVDRVGVSFSSLINGLDISDFELKRNGVAVPLGSVQLNSLGSGFELANLSSVATTAGNYTLELKAGAVSDAAGNLLAGSTLKAWTVPQRPVKYTAVGAGEGSQPTVIVFDAEGKVARTLTPYDAAYTGGVRVATGDVNGDLIDDIIVAPGRNSGPRVKVYDGKSGELISDFFALEPNFRGGILVAAGDVTGDGLAEVIVTPDKGGGPRVRVFNPLTTQTIADFFGIDDVNFRGGARAALGDVTGDGRLDVIVAAGTGGGPRIAVFDGVSVAANAPTKPFGDFLAFEANLRNGASVAAMDIDGDGNAEIIAGAGDGGGPRLTAFSGAGLMNGQKTKLADFFVGQIDTRGGLRLAVDDVNDDGNAELFVGPGAGVGSRIRVYANSDLLGRNLPFREFDPFGGFLGGVFLG